MVTGRPGSYLCRDIAQCERRVEPLQSARNARFERCNPLGLRALIALTIAVACGSMSYAATRLPGFADQDFRVWWLGANAILHGRNPYTTIIYQHRPDFLYPLSAALVTIPFADVPVTIAGPVFIAISCGLLALASTRTSWWPLLMFASGGMVMCVFAAQFTALLMLGFMFPTAMWLGALKPNIGIDMLVWRPSIRGAALMALVTAISLISMPSWPAEWLRALKGSTYHYAPVLGLGGPLILLALLRWRRPEARLLIAMALIPSSPLLYETLPLFVVARRRLEYCALAFASSVGYLLITGFSQNQIDLYMARGRWVVVWLCYLPALVIVLRRPNETKQLGRSNSVARSSLLEPEHSRDYHALVTDAEPSGSSCVAEHERSRLVLGLACLAVVVAYLCVIYVTFLHRKP